MGLFDLFRKKEDVAPVCACSCGRHAVKGAVSDVVAAGGAGLSSLKVLGAGCSSCHALLERTREAVAGLGLDVTVEYVTDLAAIAGYGVMSLPALVVNGKVVSMGKVLKKEEIGNLLRAACA